MQFGQLAQNSFPRCAEPHSHDPLIALVSDAFHKVGLYSPAHHLDRAVMSNKQVFGDLTHRGIGHTSVPPNNKQ